MPQDQVAVLIPTRSRPSLLAQRALPSVASQTRRPQLVLVVDDSPSEEERRRNREIVAELGLPGVRVEWLANARTGGAAGAWNTGLHYLHRAAPGCRVALLDDDDEWAPTYLERCAAAGLGQGADIVVAGLIRRGVNPPDKLQRVYTEGLRHADFLAGSPHWQGSNTFARLDALLAAGGFDESFPSTNDRDLGLRLLDLPWLRWAFVDEHLVVHHVGERHERLSTPGSPKKALGLQAFYDKYRSRMSAQVSAAFLARAERLFDATPTARPPPPAVRLDTNRAHRPGPAELVVGTISSPDVEVTLGLLAEVRQLAASSPATTVTLVVLDNGGPDPAARARLQGEMESAGREGLVQATLLPAASERRLSIARARTLLQRGCHRVLRGREIPVWLLDDDVRFDVLADAGDRIAWGHRPDHLAWIADLQATGADVVIGSVTGEPPLPTASAVRVQVVDLFHNLEWLSAEASRAGTDALLPSRHGENMELRRRHRDYYYDLSRADTAHLERPFWYEPRHPSATVGSAFREMVRSLEGIFAGRQVFRPLVWTPCDPCDHLSAGFHRGPNTLVLRAGCLVDVPNAAPHLAGEDTRRSDMHWALLGHHVHGWRVACAQFPVRQDRSNLRPAELDLRTLVLDIRGHAAWCALADVLQSHGAVARPLAPAPGAGFLELTTADVERVVEGTEEHLRRRLLAWEVGHARVAALARALEAFLEVRPGGGQPRHFWLGDPAFSADLSHLATFVSRLRQEFSRPADAVTRAAMDFDRADLRRFLTQLSQGASQPTPAEGACT